MLEFLANCFFVLATSGFEDSLNTQETACSPFSIYAGLRVHSDSIPVSRSLEKVRKRSVYLCFRSFILREILATNGDKLATGHFRTVLR